MIPASYRVGWAARGPIDKAPWALVFVGTAAGYAGVLTASGVAGPRLAMACAGLAIAGMIVLDFPAPSDRSYSEFELSLPLALRDLARARLVLALGVWLAPVLLVFGLGAVGLLTAPAAPAAVIAALSAIGSVVLAAVAREVLGLSGRWRERRMVGRVAALLVAAIGFIAPRAWLAPALLLAAYAWWRSALGGAPAAFELRPVVGGDAASSASPREAARPWAQLERTGGAVSALLRRHTLFSLFPAALLAGTCLWALSAESVDPSPVAVFLVLQWPASYNDVQLASVAPRAAAGRP
jgi:hypothetical protein